MLTKNFLFLIVHSWNISRGLFFLTGAKSIFTALLPLVNIAGLGLVVNALITEEPQRAVIRLILLYLAVNLGIGVTSQIFTLFTNRIGRKVTNTIQMDYMKDCVYINYHYVQDRSVLDLKKKSAGAHPAFFLEDLGKCLNYLTQLAGIVYIFSLLSPLFILIIAATSTISILYTFRKRKLDFEFTNARSEEDRKLDYLYQVMSGYDYAKEIRLNQAGSFVERKYAGLLSKQFALYSGYFRKNLRMNTISTVITMIQTAAMYLYFSYQVHATQITIAEYVVLLSTTTLLTSILLGFFDNIAVINKTCKYVDLFREYKSLIKANSQIAAPHPFSARDVDLAHAVIRFENVSFAYPNTHKTILKKLNIEIRAGEKLGIVGLNGSGKTTLIKLLTRIYDPTEGRITINGVDIREVPYERYISSIGIVLQDFVLFAYSIKENIVFDRPYDEELLVGSIRKSGLNEKIAGLANGTDTTIYKELDDHGIEFSGGEGQKLALARAIYKKAHLLILDEPTSKLDPIAEYRMFSDLAAIAENKTTLFISHRLSSTKFCDRILVLHDGEITECGNHDELMGRNGFYAELFGNQAKYYRESAAGNL